MKPTLTRAWLLRTLARELLSCLQRTTVRPRIAWLLVAPRLVAIFVPVFVRAAVFGVRLQVRGAHVRIELP